MHAGQGKMHQLISTCMLGIEKKHGGFHQLLRQPLYFSLAAELYIVQAVEQVLRSIWLQAFV